MQDNRKISQKLEDQTAKDLGGRRVVMSGGLWCRPGDTATIDILGEEKFTKDVRYNLKYTTLTKIEKQALFVRRTPIFILKFVNSSAKVLDAYVILREVDCYDESAFSSPCLIETAKMSCILKHAELKEFFNKNMFGLLKWLDTNSTYVVTEYDTAISNIDSLVLGK